MLKLIREVLKVGQATVPYPFVPVEVAPGFRGKPEYNPAAVHRLRGLHNRLPAKCSDHGDRS